MLSPVLETADFYNEDKEISSIVSSADTGFIYVNSFGFSFGERHLSEFLMPLYVLREYQSDGLGEQG